MIREGEACADFALPDDRGGNVTLESLAGRPFVLFFYPKDDTSGCTLEAIEFSALKKDFDAAGIAIFGVSPDPVKSHCKFRDKHDLAIPLLADEQKTFLEACGVWVEKSMYGRKYMGVERTTALGDANGKIVRVWPKVKVPGHAQEVLEAARSLASAA